MPVALTDNKIKLFEQLCNEAGGKVVNVNDKIACNIDGVNFDVLSTDIPVFDSAIKNQYSKNRKYDMIFKPMDIDKFFKLQYEIFETGQYAKKTPYTGEVNFWLGVDKETVEEIKEKMKEGKIFPSFVVEYDEKGNLTDFQEGRHRLVALKQLRVNKVPVWIAHKRRFY